MTAPHVLHGAADLQALLTSDSPQLLEVLGPDEYRWAHLPGAVNVPLGEIGSTVPPAVDPRRPVVAYCNDFL